MAVFNRVRTGLVVAALLAAAGCLGEDGGGDGDAAAGGTGPTGGSGGTGGMVMGGAGGTAGVSVGGTAGLGSDGGVSCLGRLCAPGEYCRHYMREGIGGSWGCVRADCAPIPSSCNGVLTCDCASGANELCCAAW